MASFNVAFTDSDGNFTAGFGSAYVSNNVLVATTAEWDAQTELVAKDGVVYVYSDRTENYNGVDVPGFKVGDGSTLLADLAFGDPVRYIHEQGTSATTWTITHNMGCFPSVTVVDTAGNVVHGNVAYDSENQITITLTAATKGKVYLN